MNISIASYAFHGLHKAEMMDLFGYLETVKYRFGLSTADIWNGMFLSTEDDYLHKIKAGLQERELTLTNLCVDGPHLWDDNADVREQHYQLARKYLNAAEVLGTNTIRIDAGGQGETWTDEAFDFIVERYREYAQRAYDHGYLVGPENHWGPEVIPDNMVKLLEAVDHPGFGLLLHFKGEMSDNARMAPWAMHTHFSWAITEGPLMECVSLLRDLNYKGSWSVEHHTGLNEYTEVAIQVAKIRDVLAQ